MKTKLFLTLFFAIVSLLGLPTFSFAQTGLIGSYPFNGNANDVSGNGNNGVVTGATLTTDRFGNLNSAYLFNGINTFIDIGNNFAYNSHSFSCWARKDSVNASNTLVSKINNGPYDFQNSEFSVNGFLQIGTGTTWTGVGSTASPIDYSQWNCYAATYNALTNTAKIYANGMVDSMVIGNYSDVINTPIYIGARPYWSGNGGPSFFFTGAIDEVNIYNRVLTQQEVDSLCPSLTSIMTITKTDKINLSPNPFSTSTTVQITNYSSTSLTTGLLRSASYECEMYDVFGRMVKQFVIRNSPFVIERDNLPSGLYFIRLTQGDKPFATDKLIITDN